MVGLMSDGETIAVAGRAMAHEDNALHSQRRDHRVAARFFLLPGAHNSPTCSSPQQAAPITTLASEGPVEGKGESS